MAKHLSEYKTQWFIGLAEESGHAVMKKEPAPNGGEVIYFEGFCSDVHNGKTNPYFMLWTGNADAGPDDHNQWHAEFGHWYFPKDAKQRKLYPPTTYFTDAEIPAAIIDYSKRAKEEQ